MNALPSPHQSDSSASGKREWSAPRLERLAASQTQTGSGGTSEVQFIGMCPAGSTMVMTVNTNCS
jgi:hypothetical protein